MSYEPTEWKNGDVITAEKLNKIENGIDGSGTGMLVIRAETPGSSTLTATFNDVASAIDSGKNVILVLEGTDTNLLDVRVLRLISFQRVRELVFFADVDEFSGAVSVHKYHADVTDGPLVSQDY